MEKNMRNFYKISTKEYEKYQELFNYEDIVIPARQTIRSCGYDFTCPYEITIKPNEVANIYTGIKVKLEDNEFLMVVIRSSKGRKEGLVLANQVGIIDADYYNNNDNDGHIIIAIRNVSGKERIVKKGDRIAQGIIQKFYIADEDKVISNIRKGGFGSTDK